MASPTFTGTATAPTINATTAIQLTGTNISTIYQTIANMGSYLLSATATTTYQTIAGMSSYLTTATASSTYQQKFWVAARVQTSGTTVLGTFGSNTITSSNINRSAVGTFTITIPSHPSGANYGLIFTSRGATASGNAQMWRYSNPSATQFTIYTYNYSTGTLEDPVDFTFHTIP